MENDSLPPLVGLEPDEICSLLNLAQGFRGRQIFQWIYRGADSFSGMTNLSKKDRETLSKKARIYSSSVTEKQKDSDGTIKLQITLDDGCSVETVLLTDREGRKTACVSCQAGCGMACAFCQTGRLGLKRNLTAGEIVEEFLYLEKEAGKLDNIVFMGMGEPLQNLDAIFKSVSILTDKQGRALSPRRITLSTCGLIKGIRELTDKEVQTGIGIRLAVSLTTADAKLRESLMPVAKSNPLPELKDAIKYYIEKTGKRVTLEAALLGGINTGRDGAESLKEFTEGLDCHINLIPWNPVPGLEFKTPSAAECSRFLKMLTDAGLNATLRTRRGSSIAGACGQLGRISC
ncbi:MAG: 23S rRNA (adenine(2503)-C(2))-methyltransferase RlmN [Treponema sp.]|nr:23S rRNA (adenine(2503)-C(2))-methyltransferase RlmN [Treponema sp.]